MDDPVAHALDLVRNFGALAQPLAKRNIVVRHLDCDWSGFGSWTVEASRGDAEAKRSSAIRRHAFSEAGPEVCRVMWDGKDRLLSVGSTPTMVSVMLNQWSTLSRNLATHLKLRSRWLRSGSVTVSVHSELLGPRALSVTPYFTVRFGAPDRGICAFWHVLAAS
jgi:hypothetical protein